MDRKTAQAAAAREGLTVQFAKTAQFSETVPAGRVLRTDPKPGGRIARNGTIVAILSKGPERYAVPKVVGLDQADAERRLRATHLSVGDVREQFHDSIDRGEVIRTEPEEGQRVRRDTAVALVVSKGPAPVQLPDVVGRAVDEATRILRDLGLRVSNREVFDPQIPPGLVLGQEPTPQVVRHGSWVALTVSKGPPLAGVPHVVGMPVKMARRVLERAGFQVQVLSLPGGPNRVMGQNPPAGSQHPPGSVVTISAF
jgi:beta-lactam-binding protein with PASTA domain